MLDGPVMYEIAVRWARVRGWASIVCISPYCDEKSVRDDEVPHLHCAATYAR